MDSLTQPYASFAPYTAYLRTKAGPGRESIAFDDDEDFLVRGFEWHDELHAPYRLEITLMARDLELDVPGLVGADFNLMFHETEPERQVRGVVLEARYVGTFSERLHVQLTVGPVLSLLHLNERSCIHQDKTVLEIVEELTKPFFTSWSRTLDASLIDTSRLPHRDYCVQYRETDLEFVRRILAEDGLTFAFDHTEDDGEVLVLLDDARLFASVGDPLVDRAGLGRRPEPSVPVATRAGLPGATEFLTRFEWVQEAQPGRAQVEAWDWKANPPILLQAHEQVEQDDPWIVGEHYVQGGSRMAEAELGEGDHIDRTAQRALAQLRNHTQRARYFTGEGNMKWLAPGRTFAIADHPLHDVEGSFYVTRVTHRADCPESDRDAVPLFQGQNYDNRFDCVPSELPFAPPQIDKRPIPGPMTATVVGPPGEDIYTDAYGRVKVRMHFDREQRDLQSDTTCWLRVVQMWAGAGWGSLFIPRVGMEVTIAFLEGDPDRPMVVGSVYNQQNLPPYLPDGRTRSTLRSRSSGGDGDGYNELRFDDAAGSEEVFIHAQKHMNMVVEDAQASSIGSSQTTRVGSNQTTNIGNHQSIRVGSNRVVRVQGNHTVVVRSDPEPDKDEPDPGPAPEPEVDEGPEPDFKGQYTLVTDGELATKVDKQIALTSYEKLVLKVAGKDGKETTLIMAPESITLEVKDGAKIDLTETILAVAKDEKAKLTLQDDATIGLVSDAGANIELKADIKAESSKGTITLTNKKTTATMSADIALESKSGSITAQDGTLGKLTMGQSKIEVSGGMVNISGKTKADFGSSGTTSLKGTNTQIGAVALASLKGAFVKIN